MARFLKDARSIPFKPGGAANDTFSGRILPENVLWKLLLLTALAYIVWSGKISIVLGPSIAGQISKAIPVEASFSGETAVNTAPQAVAQAVNRQEVFVEMPSGSLHQAAFAIDPDFGRRNGLSEGEAEKRMAVCREYLGRFAPVAVAEMRKFGIPASITLAQALLESDAGKSTMAAKTNNHFGLKCFSKSCRTGHCMNIEDESHKDFFIRYSNAWSSFRAHSELLQNGEKYRVLFQIPASDYSSWATGLADAGYAADPQYGQKLMAIIQAFRLYEYDRM